MDFIRLKDVNNSRFEKEPKSPCSLDTAQYVSLLLAFLLESFPTPGTWGCLDRAEWQKQGNEELLCKGCHNTGRTSTDIYCQVPRNGKLLWE